MNSNFLVKETIIYKSNEVEKILQNMKDIVNEYCTVNKGINCKAFF